MPREVVALVSADDVLAAIRVHADRVHDLLRRRGCGPAEAVEVCESYAAALIDALVNAPETVGDMAGWWFGRALELGRRLEPATRNRRTAGAATAPASVLSGTEGETQIRRSLAELAEAERDAVVLRDAYDLPPEAVAVALERSLDGAAQLVAAGRLHLIEQYDDQRAPSLAGHTGRGPAELGLLGRVADGSLAPQLAAPQRRHLRACAACEDVVEAQAKARRLCAGLPVIAMPDDAREAMLQRIGARAGATLPTVDDVLLAIDEDDDPQPALSPLAVVFFIVIALVLGVAVGALTAERSTGAAGFPDQPGPSPAAAAPSFSIAPTPRHRPRRTTSPTPGASTSPTGAPAAPSAPASQHPSRSPRASTSPGPVRPATITLAPARGPRGTQITVTGTGWPPGTVVTVRYIGTLTSSSAATASDGAGRFSAVITASGTLPGSYTVEATGGGRSAAATFQQTS